MDEKYNCRTVQRTFSASEAENITGVSQATQRDWRRREFLQPISGGGRARHSLEDLIFLAALGALTKSGLPVSQAVELAPLAILPVHANFSRWDDVSVFDGHKLSSEQMARIRESHVVGASDNDNWLFAALDHPGGVMGRTDDLRKLDGGLRGSLCAIILDLTSLAHRIARAAPLPLITWQIEAD